MRRRSLLRGLAALAGVGTMPLLAGEARQDSVEQPRLMLVIDDVGHSLDAGRAVLALPGPLNCAFSGCCGPTSMRSPTPRV